MGGRTLGLTGVLLDTSALIAVVRSEPGAASVVGALATA
jgi:uncharacterized protein with PIN domain